MVNFCIEPGIKLHQICGNIAAKVAQKTASHSMLNFPMEHGLKQAQLDGKTAELATLN